jgi:hypothetical protein
MSKDRFQATGDDGNVYTVEKFVPPNPIASHFEGATQAQGRRRGELRTVQGQAVNYLGKGKYQIVVTGVVLTSSDPDAP